MSNKVNRFIYWTPRVLSILFIIFLVTTSFDVITKDLSLGEILIGLLIHNIPAIILIIILIISWRVEIVGGISFIVFGLIYIFLMTRSGMNILTSFSWSLILAGPAFLIGGLFLINWYKKKK